MTRDEYNKIVTYLELFISRDAVVPHSRIEAQVPASGKTWTPSTRGRIPEWVIKAVGTSDRQVIRVTYGTSVRFVEGAPLPSKV